MTPRHPERRCAGFTLVELLVVVSILVLLAGLVGPPVLRHLSSAKSDTARLQIKDLDAALELYYLDIGRYPRAAEGLQALVRAPAGAENWNGPYLKKNEPPRDPWGQSYRYRFPGEHGPYDLYSLGADGAPGGEGNDRDVNNWE